MKKAWNANPEEVRKAIAEGMFPKPVDTANMTQKCDLCDTPNLQTYVDGKTRIGPWAYMCLKCWRRVGVGTLGTGLGQQYDFNFTTKRYEKIAG